MMAVSPPPAQSGLEPHLAAPFEQGKAFAAYKQAKKQAEAAPRDEALQAEYQLRKKEYKRGKKARPGASPGPQQDRRARTSAGSRRLAAREPGRADDADELREPHPLAPEPAEAALTPQPPRSPQTPSVTPKKKVLVQAKETSADEGKPAEEDEDDEEEFRSHDIFAKIEEEARRLNEKPPSNCCTKCLCYTFNPRNHLRLRCESNNGLRHQPLV